MTAFSGNNPNITTSSGASEREWTTLISHANSSELISLINILLSKAVDTDFWAQASHTTMHWLALIRRRQQSAANLTAEIGALMRQLDPIFDFRHSLTPNRRAFIDDLLSIDTTLFVLSTDKADDICVVSSDPTTENVYKYSVLYSNVLISSGDFFDFFVCGKQEAEYRQYGIKIEKGVWDAFNVRT